MNKRHGLLALCLVCFILTGCQSQDDSPREYVQVEIEKIPEKNEHSEDTNTEIIGTEDYQNDTEHDEEIDTADSELIDETYEEIVEEGTDELEDDEETDPSAPEENLHYIDAWGEWHDAIIRNDIKKHKYDYSNLKRNGNSYTYEDDNYYSRRGIDVSHHQGDIDFQKVKESGIDFVIVRVGYRGYNEDGTVIEDKLFRENIEKAHEANLDVGVYIFSQAINEDEAYEEARFILDAVKGYNLELPVVYDPEHIRNKKARTDDISGEQFTKNAIKFCETVKAEGYKPMIYSNIIWETEVLDLKALKDYEIWYADYERLPQTPYNYSFWQYSCTGKVNGISGNVDLDIQMIKK